MVNRTATPKMTPGRAALLGLMHRYLAGLMDVSISLLELHKLMYLLQEAGEPLRLRYAKGPYGPYAQNLRHVLGAMEGHLTAGFGEGEDAPDKQIEIVGDAVQRGEEYLTHHPKTRERFDRVSDLISGFETPFGMELLSTVHWVARQEGAKTLDGPSRRLTRGMNASRCFPRNRSALPGNPREDGLARKPSEPNSCPSLISRKRGHGRADSRL